MEMVLSIVALMLAVMIHEIAHGASALALGDPTARDAGRLSLNPLRHIDPVGTVVLPLILVFTGSPVVFGWAKPVPVNLGRMRDPQLGMWVTALAGPASNLLQAGLAVGLLRFFMPLGFVPPVEMVYFLRILVGINLVLMVFNLLPIPPLDGSKIIASVMPPSMAHAYLSLSMVGFIVLILLLNAGVLGRLLDPLFQLVDRLLAL